MEFFIFYFFIFFGSIQLLFWGVFFPKVLFYKSTTSINIQEPVSVIICAHNEAPHLKELIPLLLNQKYPDFELIVVDDRSTDSTSEIISFFQNDKLIYEKIKITPSQINPKKYALKTGIEKAKFDVILVTDADCRPMSEEWISLMQAKLCSQTDIVVGISPYQKQNSLLNQLIQFETYYTSLQYLNAVLWKIPYMGVGRNLMYRKKLFEKEWWEQFKTITGGDDDLLIGSKASSKNTKICIDEKSHVMSFPEPTWSAWFRQKWRHLSVGTAYKIKIKLLLGLLNLSQIGFHSIFLLLLIGQIFGVSRDTYSLEVIYLFRLFIFVVIMKFYFKKVNIKINWVFLLLLELLHTIYLLVVGLIALSFKRSKW